MQWPQKLIMILIWCEMNLKQIPDFKIKIKRESEIIFEKIVLKLRWLRCLDFLYWRKYDHIHKFIASKISFFQKLWNRRYFGYHGYSKTRRGIHFIRPLYYMEPLCPRSGSTAIEVWQYEFFGRGYSTFVYSAAPFI